MTSLPPARVGDAAAEIDTPALVIDLDAFERNLDRMAKFAHDTGIRVRPHAKTHKSPAVARAQMHRGAVGQCCQKVGEAEVLVQAGIENVLVSNQVVGASKVARLAALARRAWIGVCADDAEQVRAYGEAARRAQVDLHVLVEIDVGAARCGVAPGAPAVELAKVIADTPGLSFEGLQAYHGSAQHIRGHRERRAAIQTAGQGVQATAEKLGAAGLDCRTIGGAGTGSFRFETETGLWNELQPGSYCFMDADYGRNLDEGGEERSEFENALFVASTVMSASAPGRAVVDAGHKASAVDSGLPRVWRLTDTDYVSASDEHGKLSLGKSAHRLGLGDRVWLVPGHVDPTVNLHDWYVGVRGGLDDGVVECLWPVAARGALT
ncbi:MAG: DSD1 family PLP-dependent enzyme [Thalassobaculum sp.]|uniref:DSD1 family PLP-dependent enzyme n=1 Tax=Thalassobaculum sp. TaxID=2022740 RepID=UPI0032EFBF16